MDTFKPWPKPSDYNPYRLESVQGEVDRLYRALRLATIAYHDTKKELENEREAHGYYKQGFQFLKFPREVRDPIHQYSLKAPFEVQPESIIPVTHFGIQRSPWKPPSPGLCRANKQIWVETRDILYSENRFSFSLSLDMMRFEEQIGASNRDLVRRLSISCLPYLDPDQAHFDMHYNSMENWRTVLQKSKLLNVVDLKVTGEVLIGHGGVTIPLSPAFQETIEYILSRNKQERLIPRLILKVFGSEENWKFPKDWKIKVEQWFYTEYSGVGFTALILTQPLVCISEFVCIMNQSMDLSGVKCWSY